MSTPRLAYSAREERERLAEASDRELLAALRDGRAEALDELVERKTEPLVQAAYRIVADREEARDVVQVAFLRMWEKRDSYDDRWSPNTWIYRIATNLAIDQVRSRKSRQKYDEPYRRHLRQVGKGARSSLAELQSQEVEEIFAELSAELSEKQRLAFVLREVEGLSSAETADVMGCRESTVRNHVFNARKVLQREVRERYPEYLGPEGETR